MAHPLISMDGIGKRQDTVTFDARKIIIEPNFNPRGVAGLAANVATLKPQILAAGGILKRIWVRKDGDAVKLVDGESRLTAFRELLDEGKIESPLVKVELFSGMADESSRLMAAITANGGKPLEKWELGSAYIRLVNVGMDKDTIAAKLGLTLRHVTDAIELAEAPAEIREMLAVGAVTPGRVAADLKSVGPTQAVQRLTQAVAASGGRPVKRVRTLSDSPLVKAVRRLLDESMADQESPDYMTVTTSSMRDLRDALGNS